MSDFDFLGKDLKLNNDMDIEFTPDGDFEIIEGAECVAQDIRIAIFESDIYRFLNDDEATTDDIKSFIEDIINEEPRVDVETIEIEVSKTKNGNEIDFECNISFNVINEDNVQNLVFNLSDIIKIEDLNG